MNKQIDLIRIKEEKKYFPLLEESLKSSKNYANEELNRINEELAIIHKMNMSLLIYYLFSISKELKKDNEPYMINGTLSNLYILYVLGVTKFNPMEIGCCYEACIGTIDNPKEMHSINIVVREGIDKEYINRLTSIPGDEYDYVNHPEKSFQTLLIPKEIDINDVFTNVVFNNTIHPTIKDEYTYIKLLSITISESEFLNSICYFNNKYGEVDINDALEVYKDHFFDRVIQEKGFIDRYASFKVNTIFDMLKLMAHYHSTHKLDSSEDSIFSDRESVFEYFNKELGLSSNESYHLMEEIRKGKHHSFGLDKDFLNRLPKNVINDLNNIEYLFPRGHNAEHLYYYAINAYHYVNHKDEYINYNDIECDEEEFQSLK